MSYDVVKRCLPITTVTFIDSTSHMKHATFARSIPSMGLIDIIIHI